MTGVRTEQTCSCHPASPSVLVDMDVMNVVIIFVCMMCVDRRREFPNAHQKDRPHVNTSQSSQALPHYAQFLMHQQSQLTHTFTCTMFVLHLCVTDGWLLSCLLSCVVRAETPPASFQRAKLIFASNPTEGAPDTAAADG